MLVFSRPISSAIDCARETHTVWARKSCSPAARHCLNGRMTPQTDDARVAWYRDQTFARRPATARLLLH